MNLCITSLICNPNVIRVYCSIATHTATDSYMSMAPAGSFTASTFAQLVHDVEIAKDQNPKEQDIYDEPEAKCSTEMMGASNGKPTYYNVNHKGKLNDGPERKTSAENDYVL